MYEYFEHPSEMQILLYGLIAFLLFCYFAPRRKKKISLSPKIINVKTSVFIDDQDQVYVAIRKGIEDCENWDDMHDSYREIMFYKKDFPDKESQQDASILLQAYNEKSNRLLSNF